MIFLLRSHIATWKIDQQSQYLWDHEVNLLFSSPTHVLVHLSAKQWHRTVALEEATAVCVHKAPGMNWYQWQKPVNSDLFRRLLCHLLKRNAPINTRPFQSAQPLTLWCVKSTRAISDTIPPNRHSHSTLLELQISLISRVISMSQKHKSLHWWFIAGERKMSTVWFTFRVACLCLCVWRFSNVLPARSVRRWGFSKVALIKGAAVIVCRTHVHR